MSVPGRQAQSFGLTPLTSDLAWIAGVWATVLALHLTPALFAALVTFGGTRALARRLVRWRPGWPHPTGWALAVLLGVLLGLGIGVVEYAADAAQVGGGYPGLLKHMAAALETLRAGLPAALADHVPLSLDALQTALIAWLHGHASQVASQVQLWGEHTLRSVGYVLIGTVVGALMVVQLPPGAPAADAGGLARRLRRGFDALVGSFSAVVFAQVRISALNTLLTALFLLGLLPLLGFALPLPGTLLLLTFGLGLLPIVGNLISNAVILILSLHHGLPAATLALAWLGAIHKLEYLLNAQIIGNRIRAHGWELLIAMLVLEALFGLPGLISAPVLYAQIKQVLYERGAFDPEVSALAGGGARAASVQVQAEESRDARSDGPAEGPGRPST